jgi:hypothetical protein
MAITSTGITAVAGKAKVKKPFSLVAADTLNIRKNVADDATQQYTVPASKVTNVTIEFYIEEVAA